MGGKCAGSMFRVPSPAHAGNTRVMDVGAVAPNGSSPRLRETHQGHLRHRARHRFIPACGEHVEPPPSTHPHTGSSPRLRGTLCSRPRPAGRRPVHPRACGERIRKVNFDENPYGSSPRLRGTRARASRRPQPSRFIPAPAGNADVVETRSRAHPVHPRACGERVGVVRAHAGVVGSSPRLRGTPRHNTRGSAAAPVHPRACGERVGAVDEMDRERRFIPAPAGNARSRSASRRCAPVHPRACGERAARGDAHPLRYWFIPAPAGNAPRPWSGSAACTVHPRACGERAVVDAVHHPAVGSSPRLRGTPGLVSAQLADFRFIPAPAGNAATCS